MNTENIICSIFHIRLRHDAVNAMSMAKIETICSIMYSRRTTVSTKTQTMTRWSNDNDKIIQSIVHWMNGVGWKWSLHFTQHMYQSYFELNNISLETFSILETFGLSAVVPVYQWIHIFPMMIDPCCIQFNRFKTIWNRN